MSDQENTLEQPEIEWKETETILADSVIGWLIVGKVARITLGQLVHSPNMQPPRYVPVQTVAVPAEALRIMADTFTDLADRAEGVVADGIAVNAAA